MHGLASIPWSTSRLLSVATVLLAISSYGLAFGNSLKKKITPADRRIILLASSLPTLYKAPLPHQYVKGTCLPRHEIEVHDGSKTTDIGDIDTIYRDLVSLAQKRAAIGATWPIGISVLGDQKDVPDAWVTAFKPHVDWQLERMEGLNKRLYGKFAPMEMVEMAFLVDRPAAIDGKDDHANEIHIGPSPIMSTIELNHGSMWSYLGDTLMGARQGVNPANLARTSMLEDLPFRLEKNSQIIFYARQLPHRSVKGKNKVTLIGRAEYAN